MRDLVRGLFLVAVWVPLWDTLSLANVVSGIVVVAVVLAMFPTTRRGERSFALRPAPGLRLAWFVLRLVIASNLFIVREALRPRPHAHAGIVSVPLHCPSDGIVTFVAGVIALSPGTMTVEVIAMPPTIVLHVLDVRAAESVRDDVNRLESLAVHTFGARRLLALLDEPTGPVEARLDEEAR
jgi:multicomponent Na+:H+ antiporter subunit E